MNFKEYPVHPPYYLQVMRDDGSALCTLANIKHLCRQVSYIQSVLQTKRYGMMVAPLTLKRIQCLTILYFLDSPYYNWGNRSHCLDFFTSNPNSLRENEILCHYCLLKVCKIGFQLSTHAQLIPNNAYSTNMGKVSI